MEIIIVGAGDIGKEYSKVLSQMQIRHTVICRTKNTANAFNVNNFTKIIYGGIEKYLKKCDYQITHAIVAVNVEQLYKVSLTLLNFGIKNIFIEKPAGINANQINRIKKLSALHNSTVFIGYNRRSYSSVIELKKMVKADGGIISANFDFTELPQVLNNLPRNKLIIKNWFLLNSSHVVDLFLYLCGSPINYRSYTFGKINDSLNAARYCGAGITNRNILFNYSADWQGAGRWKLEIITLKNRYFLSPLEKLKKVEIGQFNIQDVKIDDELDINFKPGFYLQTHNFINHNFESLCTIEEHAKNVLFYKKIVNG
jgi:predicted dehydrogenase